MADNNSKYKIGTAVFARSIADEPLIILRVANGTYYCKLADNSDKTELVYFEGELMSLQEKKDLA